MTSLTFLYASAKNKDIIFHNCDTIVNAKKTKDNFIISPNIFTLVSRYYRIGTLVSVYCQVEAN